MGRRAYAASAVLAAVALMGVARAGAITAPQSFGDADWSPDGNQIVFTDRGSVPGDLYVMNPDGSGLRQLTQSSIKSGNYGARYPSWSPDGRTIVFGYGEEGISSIKADGTGLRRIISGLSSSPAWSPRGRKIAFGAGDELNGLSIYVVNPDGSRRQLVALHRNSNYSYNNPTWSPDGERMAFTVGPAPDTGNPDTYLGIVSRYRGRVTKYVRGAYPIDPDWSPDGRKIAYADHGNQITVLTLRSGRRQAFGAGSHPRWSPTGKQIVFSEAGAIFVMNADGTQEHQVIPHT